MIARQVKLMNRERMGALANEWVEAVNEKSTYDPNELLSIGIPAREDLLFMPEQAGFWWWLWPVNIYRYS
jgi:hypothetical protein